MCGISGVISDQGSEAIDVVSAQLQCQDHRGPDARGNFGGGGGVIAQNRLSIIDLETGDPPVTNEDRSIGAVLNGEIYNFQTLRDQLARSGHDLRTRGDTEVIAHLAESLDAPSLAARLDGMFAFAVWDRRAGRLMLGRDRIGKKPLYYWSGPGLFVFASEIKGVLAHPGVPRDLNPRAIPAYLAFGYVPTPHSFFAGIRSIPPGHVLTVSAGKEPRIERYWEPPRVAPGNHLDVSFDEAAEAVREAFDAAVRRRLISDVPVGAFLSGGLDSSAVVASMSEMSDRPVRTFTIGFDDRSGFDERPYARTVAQHFGTEHHEFVVEPDAIDLIERVVWHCDQPFGDSSSIPTYHLNRLTREHVTVAVAGDGGDELFAGYERFAAGLAVDRYLQIPRPIRSIGRRAVERIPGRLVGGRVGNVQRFADVAEQGMPAALMAWVSFIDPETQDRLLVEPDHWAYDDYAGVWAASAGLAGLDRLLDVNLRTYLVDDLLVKMDRMSMARSLEVRSPFLDPALIELTAQLPPEYKARGLTSLKRVLKHAMKDRLPREILNRRKRGFGVPLDRWFREDLASYVRGMLGSSASRVRQHLVSDEVDRIVAEHTSGQRDRGHALWILLTLEVFLRREGW